MLQSVRQWFDLLPGIINLFKLPGKWFRENGEDAHKGSIIAASFGLKCHDRNKKSTTSHLFDLRFKRRKTFREKILMELK